MTAYYNEHDPFAAAWLRELVKENLIAPGDVDERSIEDVTPNDVANYTQVHWFAGIGGWSYALRIAGWPDDRPVWTGSAPCQPFSEAGKRGGFADERHLWPAFLWHIRQRKPHTIFGEQVSSKAGLAWLDVVASDLEASGYSVGSFDLCAAGAGALHLRQRLYFVAQSKRAAIWNINRQAGDKRRQSVGAGTKSIRQGNGEASASELRARGYEFMENPTCEGEREISVRQGRQGQASTDISGGSGHDNGVAQGDTNRREWNGGGASGKKRNSESANNGGGFWADVEWLQCADGKQRPTKPGIFPLAHGFPNRVGILRGAGNAIVPPLAAEFIRAYIDEQTC